MREDWVTCEWGMKIGTYFPVHWLKSSVDATQDFSEDKRKDVFIRLFFRWTIVNPRALLHFFFTYSYWLPLFWYADFKRSGMKRLTEESGTVRGKDLPQPFCILLQWEFRAEFDHLIPYSGQASSFLFHSLFFPRFSALLLFHRLTTA